MSANAVMDLLNCPVPKSDYAQVLLAHGSGGKPMYLSAAFILEEGLALHELKRVVASISGACDAAGVQLVTGDTKVVDRGKGDKIFITTAGIGVVPAGRNLSIRNARPGDRV